MRVRRVSRVRRGMSLIEVSLVLAILGVCLTVVLGGMVATQQRVADSVVIQDATGQARRAAEAIAAELRNMNMTATDVEPDVFSDVSDLRYRVVDGWDTANSRPLLSPTRASLQFRRIYLSGTDVLRDSSIGLTELAKGVTELQMTYEVVDGEGRLTVRVRVERKVALANQTSTDTTQKRFSSTAEVTVLVRNKVADCT